MLCSVTAHLRVLVCVRCLCCRVSLLEVDRQPRLVSTHPSRLSPRLVSQSYRNRSPTASTSRSRTVRVCRRSSNGETLVLLHGTAGHSPLACTGRLRVSLRLWCSSTAAKPLSPTRSTQATREGKVCKPASVAPCPQFAARSRGEFQAGCSVGRMRSPWHWPAWSTRWSGGWHQRSRHGQRCLGTRRCTHVPTQGAPGLEPVQWLGLTLVIFGEALRKAGILTARHNFTHVVQLTRRPQHTLVTHGVYAYVRHPGYLGWFIWAVSTQARCRSSCGCIEVSRAASCALSPSAAAAQPSVHPWVRRRVVAVRWPRR